MNTIYQKALLAHHQKPHGYLALSDVFCETNDDGNSDQPLLSDIVNYLNDKAPNVAELFNDTLHENIGFVPQVSDYGSNVSCGDEIAIFVEISESESALIGEAINQAQISNIGFAGDSCAICRASASMMVQSLKHKSLAQASAIISHGFTLLAQEQFLKDDVTLPRLISEKHCDKNNSCIKNEQVNSERFELEPLSSVTQFPVRIQCASLPWATLVSALNKLLNCRK